MFERAKRICVEVWRGNHVKFVRRGEEGVRTAIVPRHREVAVGTIRSILRHAGLYADEFESY